MPKLEPASEDKGAGIMRLSSPSGVQQSCFAPVGMGRCQKGADRKVVFNPKRMSQRLSARSLTPRKTRNCGGPSPAADTALPWRLLQSAGHKQGSSVGIGTAPDLYHRLRAGHKCVAHPL